jgi:hypothetical protein
LLVDSWHARAWDDRHYRGTRKGTAVAAAVSGPPGDPESPVNGSGNWKYVSSSLGYRVQSSHARVRIGSC